MSNLPGTKKRIGAVNSNSTKIKEIRKFGIIALVFFGSLCAAGLWMKKPIPTYLFGSLAVLGFGFILIPLPMKPIYTTWLKIAHLIGQAVTTLILTLAYYMVITPVAWAHRLFSGTPFPVKPDTKALSYWVTRTEAAQPKERFLKRY
jgi:hypothetical protein